MKIAIVCDVLGEENNGTTIAAMNLIRSLKAKGHDQPKCRMPRTARTVLWEEGVSHPLLS